MKKIINFLLSVLSPLAAAPTGWAIYAGVTEQPAFPMWRPAAIVGALAIITTSIQAGLLVTDIKAYNQGMKNKTEREEYGMNDLSAWLIFGGCVLAEVTLSLLIVVIPGALVFGVLVFPLMTAAGVFGFAVRFDLERRETERTQARASKPKVTRKPPKEPVKEPETLQQVTRKPVKDDELLAFLASNPGASQQQVANHFHVTRQAVGPRIKKLYEIQPVTKESTK